MPKSVKNEVLNKFRSEFGNSMINGSNKNTYPISIGTEEDLLSKTYSQIMETFNGKDEENKAKILLC